MNGELQFGDVPLNFTPGIPAWFKGPLLPRAFLSYAEGAWGRLCLQESRSDGFLFRLFQFEVQQSAEFCCYEKDEGLQCLIALEGQFEYKLQGLRGFRAWEKDYQLFNAHSGRGVLRVPAPVPCLVANIYFPYNAYQKLQSRVPASFASFRKKLRRPFAFLKMPAKLPTRTYEDIMAIWTERYADELQALAMEFRLEQVLLKMIAEAYAPGEAPRYSPHQKIYAEAVHARLMEKPKEHPDVKEIATDLNCGVSWLQKAFKLVYGKAIYSYLREKRMLDARRRLLEGVPLKVVALDAGIKPKNFPHEFKRFFGYTVTQLRRGRK